jgi:radical SAM superfamily enzyme YgiQ (UPF0313 family)
MEKMDMTLVVAPLRWNFTTPLGLALLKSCLQENNYDSICLDLSYKYKVEYVKLLRKKSKKINHNYKTFKQTEMLLKSSSLGLPSLWLPFIKLGLAWLWARTNYPFELLESNEDGQEPIDKKVIKLYQGMAKDIIKYNPQYVGFSVDPINIGSSLNIAKILKNRFPDVKIIFGGTGILYSWQILLKKYPFIDFCVVGEAEYSLPKLLNSLDKNLSINVAGVAYNVKGNVKYSPPIGLTDMNKLPAPNYDDFKVKNYAYIGVETQRGCINRCAFCSIRFCLGSEIYREKKIKNIIKEIKILKDKYGSKFFFCDNILNASKKRIDDLCKNLMKENISWEGFFFPNIDKETAMLMKKAGCRLAWLGIESFDDETLSKMNKMIKKENIVKTIKNLHEAGVPIEAQILALFPTESLIGFLKTCYNLLKYNRFIDGLDMATFVNTYNSLVHRNPERYDIRLIRKDDNVFKIFSSVPYTQNKFLKNTISLPLIKFVKFVFRLQGKEIKQILEQDKCWYGFL